MLDELESTFLDDNESFEFTFRNGDFDTLKIGGTGPVGADLTAERGGLEVVFALDGTNFFTDPGQCSFRLDALEDTEPVEFRDRGTVLTGPRGSGMLSCQQVADVRDQVVVSFDAILRLEPVEVGGVLERPATTTTAPVPPTTSPP